MTDAWREAPQLVPPAVTERDRILPIIVGVSLLIHLGILVPLGLHERAGPPPLQEIPVELVQLPPDKPKPPERKTAPAPPPKASPKQAEQPPPKPPPAPKPEPQKQPDTQPQKQARKAAPSTADRMKSLLGQPPDGMGTEPQDLGGFPLPGAVALPGEAANGSLAVAYPQLVMSKIAKAKKQGRYQGVPGKTVVAFELTDTGDVVNVRISPPSGNPTLDEEAIEMVKRGAPYPPPPPGAKRDFAVGLIFKAEPN